MIPTVTRFHARYLLPLLSLLAVVFVAITTQAVRTQRDLLERELERSALATAKELASRSEVAVLLADSMALIGELERAMIANADASGAAILDSAGMTLARAGRMATRSPSSTPARQTTPWVESSEAYATAVVPILDRAGNVMGQAVMQVRTARVVAIVRRAALGLLFASSIGFLAVALLAGMLLRRIRHLAETLEQRVTERTQDLARSTAEVAGTALFATLNPSPVIRFDRTGRMMWSNPEADRLLAHQLRAQASDHRVMCQVFPELSGLDMCALIDADARAVHVVGHGDQMFQVNIRGVAAHGFGHAYFADISAQKRGEAELAEARDRALDASRMKSQFLANMSHEIRTPMNGVLGMLSLLTETPLNTKQSEFVRIASTSAQALLTVIDDILDFSKIEAGRLDLERATFDVRTTVEDVAQLLSGRAHAKGLELTCYVSPTVPDRVVGDSVRLRQVLLNLGGNAVKFTAQGTVHMEVEVDACEATSARLHFSVRDTGIGMSPDTCARLFEPFTQADTSMTRRFGGTGLGLSISHRLVDLMGSSIGVQSAVGRGSTFWFTLDFPVSQPRVATPRAGAVRRALIVDASTSACDVVARYLHSEGIQAASAASVAEATAHLATMNGPPHVIIIADGLPADGTSMLARAIRDIPAYAAVRLLRVTAEGSGVRGPCDSALFDGQITKPVRLHELLGAVDATHHARRSEPAAEVAIAPAPLEIEPLAVREPTTTNRVLLAEDDSTNQFLATELLKSAGYQVDVVENGAEAIKARFRAEYAVILMDCQMPVMDGLTAARAIRAREDTLGMMRVPIAALTANAQEGDRQASHEAGMNAYLSKPYSPAGLVELVRRMIDDAQPCKRNGAQKPGGDSAYVVSDESEVCDRVTGDDTGCVQTD